ncbi:MAG: SAM-dependent chlorinase/fluorinase [Candidatus Thorarchaeota archaeon]|nr:SAM-dependent chlorinase/fluorinase [Candidatus Thorarchaeota archaeon]
MIVLLTDFGESEYVGVMKGVIYSLCPTEQIVDLTHTIPPQSIREGAWVLLNSYNSFPRGTVFVCVVDPGVGTGRDPVLVKTKNYTFIGPDNGLLYPATASDGVESISTIIIDEDASNTFHGRDVFAPAAAYFIRNQSGKVLGGFKQSLGVSLKFNQNERKGEVVRIDRFGNIITNIPPADKIQYLLATSDLRWNVQWYPTYFLGPDRGIFIVTGSYGTLEIAVKHGDAREEVPFKIGDELSLE